jgi:hypothetical protein
MAKPLFFAHGRLTNLLSVLTDLRLIRSKPDAGRSLAARIPSGSAVASILRAGGRPQLFNRPSAEDPDL